VGIGACSVSSVMILVGSITISGITSSFAEKGEIPD
jgi:hypothetical protein